MKDENQQKKKGRLSREERLFIAESIASKSPFEIAKEINRHISPVFAYLDSHVPDWRNHGKRVISDEDYDPSNVKKLHKKILTLSKESGMDYAEVKRNLSKGTHRGTHTLYQLEDLKRALEDLTSSIDENISSWKEAAIESAAEELAAERRSVEVQRALLHGEIMKKYNMDFPPQPIHTVEDFLNEYKGKKIVHGVYFGWEQGQVVYVGKSSDIRLRMLKHHKLKKDMLFSFLEIPKDKLYTTECFYIWCLSPKLNSEVEEDSHYVPVEHNKLVTKIKSKNHD